MLGIMYLNPTISMEMLNNVEYGYKWMYTVEILKIGIK